jgi:SAM-dependent methyltransferase
VKSVIKRFLPSPIKSFIVRRHTSHIQRQYAALSLADTFEHIYNSNAWGGNGTIHSGTGSTGRYVENYCQLLQPLFTTYNISSVADLGCGNFNTGKLIAALVSQYTGVDIAQVVIDANTQHYSSDRIHFLRADLTRDSLPPADAAVLRQVLQHLTNSEIIAALDNILRMYPVVFVTEHIYVGRSAKMNLDIAHGPGTRVPMRSGIWVDQPPFNAPAKWVGDIDYAPDEVLRTWVLKGRGELR